MAARIRVAVLFGGKSAEHEVSLQSAKNVIGALDKSKYDVVPIAIGKDGRWYLSEDEVAITCGDKKDQLVSLQRLDQSQSIDVVFPVLHGTYGEDGTVQGLLKLAGVPFVGPSVLGSAVAMDKDVSKRLMRDAGIAIADFFAFDRNDNISFEQVTEKLGLPLFVKPANLGSSVGVHKVRNKDEFKAAVEDAFRYDKKIIVEEAIDGREIECSVLGNEKPIASLPGEVVPVHEFYSYAAKYIDANGARIEIPAKLSNEMVAKIQELSIKTFKVLCLEGMSRVDFFVTKDNKIYVNEVNTIPGFTQISQYPKLWEVSGMPIAELLDRLIALAIDRQKKENALDTQCHVTAGELLDKLSGAAATKNSAEVIAK